MSEKSAEIAKLQDNLPVIRRAGGWNANEFAKKIGISRQSLSKLENHDTTMSTTTYIAIRTLLEYEMSIQPENDILRAVVSMCLDNKKLTDEDRDKITAYLTGAKQHGLDNTAIIAGIAGLVGLTAGVLIGAGIVPATKWLSDFLSKKD